MNIINRIKQSAFYYRMKHSIRIYDVLYVDSTELLDKAQKVLRPLPEGCELVKLTRENKDKYKCKWKVNKILSVEGEAWAVVNNDNEIIAYHYGTYRDNNSILFKVENCDYEHTEIMVDERYRRKGLAVYLIYHAVKNLKFKNAEIIRVGTVIRPNNIPSKKLHELIGFKKTNRVRFFHWERIKNGNYKYTNIPHYSI